MVDLAPSNRREPTSYRSSSHKSLSVSTPKVVYCTDDTNKNAESFRFPTPSSIRQLKPVRAQQRQLLTYVDSIDTEIGHTLQRNHSKIQVRYIMILHVIRELKRELEKAQIRYKQLYEKLNKSPNIVNYQRESEFAKSFYLQLEDYHTKIQENIGGSKRRAQTDKQKLFQKKELLKAKCHENLTLAAKIHQIKMTVNIKKLRYPKSKSVPRGSGNPHRFVIYSPTFEVNRAKRAKILPSDTSTNHYYRTKHLSTEPTSIMTEGAHNMSMLDQHTANSSSFFIDEASMLRREIKELQNENQKMKLKLFAKCSEFIELSKLFASCFETAEKYLKKDQSVSMGHGMQGTLLFALMTENNKKQVSEFGPSMMTMENFRRQPKASFAKESDVESRDVVQSALKKLIRAAHSNKEQRLSSVLPQLTPEILRNFLPMQVVAILAMKSKANNEFRSLFIAKARAATWIATETKNINSARMLLI